MKIGLLIPQHELGCNGEQVRTFAQTAEALGYHHLVVSDSVLSEPPDHHPLFEPFTLLALLAGCTRRIELVTGVIVAPSRQTLLLAKQAASVDVLSGGRLRLGVGLGWSAIEYQAMHTPFQERGARMEEQIAVLRTLWTRPTVTFQGKWHTLEEVSLPPLPLQQPFPLWLGGQAKAALQRIGRLGDGWISVGENPLDAAMYNRLQEQITSLRDAQRAIGRPEEAVGIDAQAGVRLRRDGEESWIAQVEAWRALGATHLSIDTSKAGLSSLQAHLAMLVRIKEVLHI